MLVFADSNLLVYARDTSEGDKHARARDWMAYLWRSRAGRVSFQVLQEYYVTVTRKLDPGLGSDEARADVRALRAWQPIPVAETTLDAAWTIEDEHGFAFWDALIVAAAKAGRCGVLLTEDLQHDQLVDDIRVLSPFQTAPFALDD